MAGVGAWCIVGATRHRMFDQLWKIKTWERVLYASSLSDDTPLLCLQCLPSGLHSLGLFSLEWTALPSLYSVHGNTLPVHLPVAALPVGRFLDGLVAV